MVGVQRFIASLGRKSPSFHRPQSGVPRQQFVLSACNNRRASSIPQPGKDSGEFIRVKPDAVVLAEIDDDSAGMTVIQPIHQLATNHARLVERGSPRHIRIVDAGNLPGREADRGQRRHCVLSGAIS